MIARLPDPLGSALEVIDELRAQLWEARITNAQLADVGARLQIGVMVQASAWALGDWLAYGNGLGDWGDTYGEAHRITGRSFESLSQHARVSRAFPFQTRTVAVCWSIYRAVAALPPEDRARVIEVAAANHWTRDDTDRFIATRETVPIEQFEEARAALATVNRRKVSKWRDPSTQVKKRRIACPNCGHQFDIRRQA